MIDVIRIVAACAVVMIHCASTFVSQNKPETAEFLIGNLFDSIARIGVPLFLMISGSLFLDENKKVTLKGILSKNVKSLAVITLIWSVIYATAYNVIFPLSNGQSIQTKDTLLAVLNGHYHMWYLYMLIGLYLMKERIKKSGK